MSSIPEAGMKGGERGEAAIRTLEKLGGCQERHRGHVNVFCAECHGHEVSSLQATIRELVEAGKDLVDEYERFFISERGNKVPRPDVELEYFAMKKSIEKATKEGRG
jgi:hypothetical protein